MLCCIAREFQYLWKLREEIDGFLRFVSQNFVVFGAEYVGIKNVPSRKFCICAAFVFGIK